MTIGQNKIFFSNKKDVFVQNQKEIISFLTGKSDLDQALLEDILTVEISFEGKDGTLKSIPFSEIYLQRKQQNAACLRCILQDIESRIRVENKTSSDISAPINKK
jgi:hypothetical protein